MWWGQCHQWNALPRFSKLLQHPVARLRTVAANQTTEGFEFCRLIGSQRCHCCTGSCKNTAASVRWSWSRNSVESWTLQVVQKYLAVWESCFQRYMARWWLLPVQYAYNNPKLWKALKAHRTYQAIGSWSDSHRSTWIFSLLNRSNKCCFTIYWSL